MRIITLAAVALILIQGCAECENWAELPVPVNAQNEAEFAAIEGLNQAFGRELFVVDEEGININYVPRDELGKSKVGCAKLECSGGDITIDSSIKIYEVYEDLLSSRNIIAHELFHQLGFLGHTSSGLMRSIVDPAQEISGPISDLITDELRDWVERNYP